MEYPLQLRFKLFAFSTQIKISDAHGKTIMYVQQKMLRLKEKIDVYSDEAKANKVFEINADRILDFSANYKFTAADGSDWGSVRRRGMRSLWSAHYEVIEDGRVDMNIREESAIKRLIEAVLSEIPFVGFFFVYILNPTYLITLADGSSAFRAIKKPSIFERFFVIEKKADVDADDELRALLSMIVMVLLEKSRG